MLARPVSAASSSLAPLVRGVTPAKIDALNATFMGVLSASTAPAPDAKPLVETEEVNAVVGRCVDVVALAFAACRPQLFDVTDRESEEEIQEHQALDLLRHINPVWQPNLYWQHVIGDLLTAGNSYTWVDIDAIGRPMNLFRIKPTQMHVIPDPSNRIVQGYVYVDEHGDEWPYSTNEILHVRTRNLLHPFLGMPTIGRLRHELLLEEQMSNWQYHQFKNGIPTQLLIKTNRIMGSEEELRQFSEHIRQNFAGPKNAGRPMIFQKGDFEFDQLPRPTEEEIAFLASMRFTMDKIAMMFGVPPSKLMNFSADSALTGGSNAEIQERSFWTDTVMSWQRIVSEFWDSVMLKRFFPKENLELRWDTSHIKSLNTTQKDMADVAAIAVNKWMTINEARDRAGMDAYPEAFADKLPDPGLAAKALADLASSGGSGAPPKPGSASDNPQDPAKAEPPKKKLAIVRMVPTKLLDEPEEARLLAQKVRAIIQEMYRIAGEQHLQVSGAPVVAFDVSDPNVLLFIQTQSINLAQPVVRTTIEMLRKAIAEAVNTGTPVAGMREAVQAAFAERRADWQLDRIARTETHQAQEAGSWLAAKQNAIEFKRWVSSRDEKVRGNKSTDEADHVTLDLLPAWPMDQPWIDPRNDGRLLFPGDSSAPASSVINCFPAETLVRGEIVGGLKAWYSGPMIELETARGNRLTLTPNHPVLTRRGWIPAADLREGDRLASYGGPIQPTAVLREVDDEHRESTIEEIFDSLRGDAGSQRIKIAPLDLDGDARWADEEIDIVTADAGLRPERQPPTNRGRECELILAATPLATHANPRGGELALNGGAIASRPFDPFSRTPTPHFDSISLECAPDHLPGHPVSGRKLLDAFATAVAADERIRVGGIPGRAMCQPHRVGLFPEWDSLPTKPSEDRSQVDSEFLGELISASSGAVVEDELIRIVRIPKWLGHVYDLQSTSGYIITNGVVSSNCRCTWISDFSHLKNWAPPEPEYVWLRKAARQRDFQKVMRGFINKQIRGMEERALAVFDAQAQIAA